MEKNIIVDFQALTLKKLKEFLATLEDNIYVNLNVPILLEGFKEGFNPLTILKDNHKKVCFTLSYHDLEDRIIRTLVDQQPDIVIVEASSLNLMEIVLKRFNNIYTEYENKITELEKNYSYPACALKSALEKIVANKPIFLAETKYSRNKNMICTDEKIKNYQEIGFDGILGSSWECIYAKNFCSSAFITASKQNNEDVNNCIDMLYVDEYTKDSKKEFQENQKEPEICLAKNQKVQNVIKYNLKLEDLKKIYEYPEKLKYLADSMARLISKYYPDCQMIIGYDNWAILVAERLNLPYATLYNYLPPLAKEGQNVIILNSITKNSLDIVNDLKKLNTDILGLASIIESDNSRLIENQIEYHGLINEENPQLIRKK